jgi:hypothetical protein
MRIVKYLLIVFAAVTAFIACQKELSFDGGISEGTLKANSGGDCLPSTVYGQYQKDTGLTPLNYIDVQVNVTFPGTYSITSDTVNGYSFKGTGTLGNPGLNTVRLYGSGKPLATGTDLFIIRYGTSTCVALITVTTPGGGGGLAVFTLGGAPGSCTGAVQNGVFTAGTALNATNSITITVNVTTIGTFLIGSLPTNGMTFGAAGTFTATGVQQVTLAGIGTPIAAGINNVTITSGTTNCTASVTTLAAGASAAFTLGGAGGACTPVTVNGTYTAGTILTTANTVSIQVNVTSIGAYAITTTTANGIQFAAAGVFTATGAQTVSLTGIGTPAVAGPFNYSATGGGTTCTFAVTAGGGSTSGVYTLSGAPASCTGAVANGTYTAGTPLNATNTVTINVNVTTAGSYSITTTTVNGISFAATGTFAGTGAQTVNLVGTGTPTAAGSFNYPATGGGNTCTFSVTAVGGGGGAAAFTLTGAPGSCTGATTNGTYTVGTALTAANTVSIGVNVTVLGTYSITTLTNNGISFSKSGTFTVLGAQNVILNGTGTPTAAGNFNFSATGTGTGSTCTFSVTCNGVVTNNDYFPLTQNSYWSYDLLLQGVSIGDSLYKVSDVQSNIGGNTYRNFKYGIGTTLDELTRYRKTGNDYYEYILVDSFTYSTIFDVEQFAEILFLKENATIGTTWQSAEFTGLENGLPMKMKYVFNIEQNNTTVTVNGVTYNNVIKVAWKIQVDRGAGYIDDTIMESWYSKGIGQVKFRRYEAGTPANELLDNLRYYQVL